MTSSANKVAVARCPNCKADAAADYKPFCSKRCADVDLGRWFTGAYVVEGREDDDDPDRGTNQLRSDTDEPKDG